jgi:hypothetical protein
MMVFRLRELSAQYHEQSVRFRTQHAEWAGAVPATEKVRQSGKELADKY